MIQKVPKKSKLSSSIYYLLKVKIRCFSFSKRANTSAMLIPLMNNEERHLIGIRYKENDNADAFMEQHFSRELTKYRRWIEILLQEYYDPMHDYQI